MTKVSKFISLLLRHHPEVLNLKMDEHGWVSVIDLVEGINQGQPFTLEDLQTIVATDQKQRYSFNEDGSKIRANQGHSIDVDLELEPTCPPDVLYHGSATRFQASIHHQGLLPQSRLYVHLSSDVATAKAVGKRHGKVIVYMIDAKQMVQDGYLFYLSKNKVWLTKEVPVQYLEVMEIE